MSELPRSKGARPIFLASAVNDDLLAMVMALTQELAVLRERCDTTERLLVEKGVLAGDDIESYVADRSTDEARETWRRDYLDRILYVINCRADEKIAAESYAGYIDIVREVGKADA
jgi:hypothetical protein